MAEDKVISLCTVLPEILFKLCGRLRLDMTNAGAETIADPQEPTIGASVPRLIGNWTRREQSNAEPFRGLIRTSERDAGYQRRDSYTANVDKCG
jgi:hypothetical protein